MSGDAKSGAEYLPFLGLEVKQLDSVAVVVGLGLLFAEQIVVRLDVAASRHDSVVECWVCGVLKNTREMLAATLPHLRFNWSEFLSFNVEHKTFIQISSKL